MSQAFATKLTKGGQTTVPKEIRAALGIGEESRVYWRLEGCRATISSEPLLPNEVSSPEEFWDGIGLALDQVAAGKTHTTAGLSNSLRKKYGLR